MEPEKKLADFIVNAKYEDLPQEAIETVKTIMVDIAGTTIAGSTSEGCEDLVDLVKEWGGKEEATILIHGCKVPAYNAVFVNSYIGRALDYENAHMPGAHFSVSCVPVALAAAELRGGLSGKDFLAAIIAGSEVGYRMNACTKYDGLDPTGYGPLFSATGVAGKVLGLNGEQVLNALGLALNKCAGSFQANIDGSLGVRLIQGWTSRSAMISALLAQKGYTGVKNFIEGVYGYFHLFSKDKKYDSDILLGELGKRYNILNTLFKAYPSCGCTLTSTDLALAMVREYGIKAEDVEEVNVRLHTYHYNLTGHPFKIGNNPRVDAQFSIRYCVANVLMRGQPKLEHFDPTSINELAKTELIDKVNVMGGDEVPFMLQEMVLKTKEGNEYKKTQDVIRGMPPNPLSKEEHLTRYWDCIHYGSKPLPNGNPDKILTFIDNLEEIDNVCDIISLLTA